MLVRDWMTQGPLTASPDLPVMDALRLLSERGFRRLPVLDDAGRLIGITTRKDLKDATPSRATTLSVWELNTLLSRLTVGEMMARPVITAYEDEYMEDAALRMQRERVGGLPVLGEQGDLRGIITVGDVLRAFTSTLGLPEQGGQAGGERLTLDMPDVPGSLARAVGAVLPSNIVSVASYAGAEGRRRFVMRLTGEGTRGARRRVRDAGIAVLD